MMLRPHCPWGGYSAAMATRKEAGACRLTAGRSAGQVGSFALRKAAIFASSSVEVKHGRMALAPRDDNRHAGVAPCHLRYRVLREKIGVLAADRHERAVLQALELRPQCRQGRVEVDPVQLPDERRIVVCDDAAVGFAEDGAGHVVPVLVLQQGKGPAPGVPQQPGGIRPVARRRHALEIGLDLHEARSVDHRPGVVEHCGEDCCGPSRRQHVNDEDAARGADEGSRVDAKRRHAGEYVVRLGLQRVAGAAAVPFGPPPAAIVEGNDPPGIVRIAGKRQRQTVEVAAVARQARQADDRHRMRMRAPVASAVVTRVQQEPVGGRERDRLEAVPDVGVHGRARGTLRESHRTIRRGAAYDRPKRRSWTMLTGWSRRAL